MLSDSAVSVFNKVESLVMMKGRVFNICNTVPQPLQDEVDTTQPNPTLCIHSNATTRGSP